MNLGDDANRLAAEARARVTIDRQLTEAGWSVQDSRSLNLFAAQGVARREATMATGHGRADYLLYVDQRVVGVIEAKPEGTPLSGVEWQSAMYADGLPADVKLAALTKDGRLPFVFEASGTETHFTNGTRRPERSSSWRRTSVPSAPGPHRSTATSTATRPNGAPNIPARNRPQRAGPLTSARMTPAVPPDPGQRPLGVPSDRRSLRTLRGLRAPARL